MRVEFQYSSTNPSCSSVIAWQGPDRIAKIDESGLLEILTRRQKDAWFSGQTTFNIKPAQLREHSTKNYRRF